MEDARGISLLLITGTMGAGKSTVMAEASDLLAIHHIEHAAIDVDGLGVAYMSSTRHNNDVVYANLESVCANYAHLGVQRFVLAQALETRADLERCVKATSARAAVVCRLIASMSTMKQRVKLREPGLLQAEFVARVEELSTILDASALEDFTLTNENRSVTEIAREMLIRAGWLSESDSRPLDQAAR